MALALRSGAPCRCAVPEEYLGPSVVSLVHSCLSRCPETAPGGEERMVFLVGRWISRLESSADRAGVAFVLRIGAGCRRTVPEELLGRSVVSLVLSCVSRCPETARVARYARCSVLGGGSRGLKALRILREWR